MLNKELLLAGGAFVDPVLAIYISPDVEYPPTVSGTLSSGEPFYVSDAGETTFKFSEIDLTADILAKNYGAAQLSTSNLMPASASYSGGAEQATALMLETLRISDMTQSASISLV